MRSRLVLEVLLAEFMGAGTHNLKSKSTAPYVYIYVMIRKSLVFAGPEDR